MNIKKDAEVAPSPTSQINESSKKTTDMLVESSATGPSANITPSAPLASSINDKKISALDNMDAELNNLLSGLDDLI